MDQKSDKPSQKRRAILQGSLAAPLVLTVSAAGAQTALSSAGRALRNLQNDPQQGDTTHYFRNSPDNWLRREVTVVKITDPFNAVAYYYADPSGFYYRVSPAFAKMQFGPGNVPLGWVVDSSDTMKKYLLVWVHPNDGSLYATATAEPVGNLIGATCSALNSVNPVAPCPTGNIL